MSSISNFIQADYTYCSTTYKVGDLVDLGQASGGPLMIGTTVAASTTVALNVLSPHSLLSSLGAVGVFLVLFAETGLLIGFFLPGDSLLFTAGVLCATGNSSSLHL